MNLRALSKRMQNALLQKGVRVSINQLQRYSEKAERMVTKYVVTQPKYFKDEEKWKNVTICETYQIIDVVKTLADLLKDDGGGREC